MRNLFALLAVFAVAFAPWAAAAAESLTGARPNVILMITDDQGYPPVGRHRHSWIQTPHLDQLYDASTRFTRFLVSPTCAPTRAAMMTGRHSMRNGVTHTILERERMTLQATTLPQVLKTVGYTSGIFGKWHLGDEEPYQPDRRGFDEAFIHGAGGIGQATAYDAWWKETRPMMVNENVPMSPTRPFHEWYHQQLQSGGIPDWKPSE